VTWESLRRLYKGPDAPKLCGIADITCDVGGSIECNVKTTNSEMPAYLCNPMDRSITDGHKGEGIVLLAVDNLPAEIPSDSSRFFSNQLKAFIGNLVNADYDKSLEKSGLCPEIQRAVIAYNGELTSPYKNLEPCVS
jgi:alpha-aminoadipic semialdehyde synthase